MSDSARSAISATSLRIWFFVCSSRPGSMVSSGMVAPGGLEIASVPQAPTGRALAPGDDHGTRFAKAASQTQHPQRDVHHRELPARFFAGISNRLLNPPGDRPEKIGDLGRAEGIG